MNMRTHKKQVLHLLKEQFEELGFKKKKVLFFRVIADGLEGTLGLNMFTHGSSTTLGVNPGIGVLHHRINEMFYTLIDHTNTFGTPTVGLPLYSLISSKTYICWKFVIGKDVEHVATDLVTQLKRYGFPWMESMVDEDRFIESVRTDGAPGQRQYLVPFVLKYFGKLEDMEEALIEFHPKNAKPNPAVESLFANSKDFEVIMSAPWRPPSQEQIDEYDNFIEKLRALEISKLK